MMKTSNNRTIVLFVFLMSCLAFPCVNSSVTCSSSGVTLQCTIVTTNSTLIQETIASSFEAGNTKLEIIVGRAGGNAILNLSLPDNITEMTVKNDAALFIETNTVCSGVEVISFLKRKIVTIKQRNFFAFFPNLKHFKALNLGSVFFPSFTQNKQLTKIDIAKYEIEDVSSRVINHTIFSGLDKLESLTLKYGSITGIRSGTFKGLSKLTMLNLNYNKIEELKSCSFEGLENVDTLDLSRNEITSVHPNAFLGLNNLKTLEAGNNPSMPLPAITVLKNLTTLSLSGIILPEIVQQLPNLTDLIIKSTTFNCTCDTEWIYKLSSFGVTIDEERSHCIESRLLVTNPASYTNCEARSYQCFNKSIVCVGENWSRVDTGDGCECVYPEASYTVSEICNDINECENSTICQGNCTNTPGSYKCSCLEGFHNVNDTLCGDIDECIVGNGNCSHNCSNSLGSFECFCLSGYEKLGFSDCVDTNECLLYNGNCSHNCSNTVGSYECTCLPGYIKHGSTECALPDSCSINNGGCHHNCTDIINAYVCSCLAGFEVSTLNSSHCVARDINTGTGATSKAPAFYVLFFICFLFLVAIILLFLFIIFVFLYFRRQMQQLKLTHTSKVLSLAELDNKKQKDSTVFKSPSNDSVPVN